MFMNDHSLRGKKAVAEQVKKKHFTNGFVGGVGFFAVHEQTYIVVHEQ